MDKKKLMMIGGAAVALLAGGGGAAYYFGVFGGGEEVEASTVEPVEVPAGLLELEPFLTNIADKRDDHAARLQVKLVIAPADKIAEIEGDVLVMARLRDSILSLLATKSYSDLKGPEGKEGFRTELFESLKAQFGDAELREVLFGDFIVQ